MGGVGTQNAPKNNQMLCPTFEVVPRFVAYINFVVVLYEIYIRASTACFSPESVEVLKTHLNFGSLFGTAWMNNFPLK